jgi:hypothetical protein
MQWAFLDLDHALDLDLFRHPTTPAEDRVSMRAQKLKRKTEKSQGSDQDHEHDQDQENTDP